MPGPIEPETAGAPGHRFFVAVVLGHLAGAYVFVVTTILFGALTDLWFEGPAAITPSTWSRLFEGILVFPVVTVLLGLWGAVMMIPMTILTLPIAWLAARRLRMGVAATVALGALTGLLPAFVMLHGAPKLDVRLFGSAAAAGAAFASIIWWLCIRPRRTLRQPAVGSVAQRRLGSDGIGRS